MSIRTVSALLRCAIVAACTVGCPGSIDDPGRFLDAGGACAFGDEWVERRLFPETCGVDSCHGTTFPAADLDLVSPGVASRIVGVQGSLTCGGAPLVDPSNPAGSLFVAKLGANPGCGSRMPLGAPALDRSRIECVQQWLIAAALPRDGGVDGGHE